MNLFHHSPDNILNPQDVERLEQRFSFEYEKKFLKNNSEIIYSSPEIIHSKGFNISLLEQQLCRDDFVQPGFNKFSLTKLFNNHFLGQKRYELLPANSTFAYITDLFFKDIDDKNTNPEKIQKGEWFYEALIYTIEKNETLLTSAYLSKEGIPEHNIELIFKNLTSLQKVFGFY